MISSYLKNLEKRCHCGFLQIASAFDRLAIAPQDRCARAVGDLSQVNGVHVWRRRPLRQPGDLSDLHTAVGSKDRVCTQISQDPVLQSV